MTTSKTTPHFSVSPRVLGPLGAEQLQDPALAVLELIKNAWDADATRVTIRVDQRVKSGGITVLDDGHGMSTTDFSERWLVIGASRKRGREKSEGGRPLIGEKGLGRYFFMRSRVRCMSCCWVTWRKSISVSLT